MISSRWIVLAVAVAGIVVAGCSDSDGDSACGSGCLPGQTCNESTGMCESLSQCEPACAAGQTCDPTTKTCVTDNTPKCPSPCPTGTACNASTGVCEQLNPSGCSPPCGAGNRCDITTKTCVPELPPPEQVCAAARDCVRRAADPFAAGTCAGSPADDEAKQKLQAVLDCKDKQAQTSACQDQTCAERDKGGYELQRCNSCAMNGCSAEIAACQADRCGDKCADPAATYDIILQYVTTDGCGTFDTCDVVVELTVGAESAESDKIESDTPFFGQTLLSLPAGDIKQLGVKVIDKNILPDDEIGTCNLPVDDKALAFGRVVSACGDVKEIAFDLIKK